jgi:hypothetical protein
MWIVLSRQPRPPARIWAGRKLLACADAIAWPAAWIAVVSQAPMDVGLVGQASIAVALLLAVRGVWTAALHNERYRFISWRLWRVVWPLLAVGVALQIAFWLGRSTV